MPNESSRSDISCSAGESVKVGMQLKECKISDNIPQENFTVKLLFKFSFWCQDIQKMLLLPTAANC